MLDKGEEAIMIKPILLLLAFASSAAVVDARGEGVRSEVRGERPGMDASLRSEESQIKLEDGPGRDLVAAVCAVCHSTDYIQMNSMFLDRQGWETVVNKMVHVMGAPIQEKDIPQIVDYLTKYYDNSK